MTRLHAPALELVIRDRIPDYQLWLGSPAPGWFHAEVGIHTWLEAGAHLGTLTTLGRTVALVVPPGIAGAVVELIIQPTGRVLAPRAVQYGEVVLALDISGAAVGAAAAGATAAPGPAASGRVFRAPTSGRFYSRSAPDKPVFVSAGDQLVQGATICLLEVMKTFHRVTYSGEPATVREVLVADGADVNAGDPLVAFED